MDGMGCYPDHYPDPTHTHTHTHTHTPVSTSTFGSCALHCQHFLPARKTIEISPPANNTVILASGYIELDPTPNALFIIMVYSNKPGRWQVKVSFIKGAMKKEWGVHTPMYMVVNNN